ncbi:peptide deformylase [Streptomyces sp. NPDC032940]|uniref:peptide deformylase n=1 Tax=Streptomyces sp. NPDC032940 TaxID=3155366 RepID=UPI00340BB052
MGAPSEHASLAEQVEELLGTDGPLPILAAGDPVLRRAAEPFDGQLEPALLARFVEALRVTMHAAPGVGLAAPQVGVGLRIAVIEDPAPVPDEVRVARGRVPQPFRVLVNPRYEPVGAGRAAFYEGCLSVPGWPARIVQHETDHLDGTLYLDRAELRSLASGEAVAERWAQPTPERAAAALGFDLP